MSESSEAPDISSLVETSSIPLIPGGIKRESGDFSQNPGTFEDLFRKFKELSPMCFEGARFTASKALSSHLQINHSLSMGSTSSFKCGASYVGTNQYSASEIFPVMIGDMDANGTLNANLIHQYNDRLRGKMIVQISKNIVNAVQLSADYRFPRSTVSAHLVNVDVIRREGLFIGQYLTRFSDKTDIGIEFAQNLSDSARSITPASSSLLQFAARYRGYWHRRKMSAIQFAAELEASANEAISTLSYQVDLDKTGDCTFKAFVDSNWNVGAILEKRLGQLPFNFILSGLVNHGTGASKFGFGMSVGS